MAGIYKDPFSVLSMMREIGLRNPEASITSLTLVFRSVEEFMDYQLGGSLEYAEMGRERQEKFGRECSATLKQFVTDDGLVDNGEVVFFSGYK